MTMGRIGWYAPETSKRPKGAVLEVHLADGGALLATEGGTRKSMRVGLYDAAGIDGLTGHLGPEPLETRSTSPRCTPCSTRRRGS